MGNPAASAMGSLRVVAIVALCVGQAEAALFLGRARAAPKACIVYNDTDIDPHTPGLGNIAASNISTCCVACQSDAWRQRGCQYFTLSKGNCWFKATAAVQVVSPGKTSGSCLLYTSPSPRD